MSTQKCVLINKDFTSSIMSIDDFNRKYVKIKNKGKSEYVLIPITPYSESYVVIPTICIPDVFTPTTIKYTLSIKVLHGRSNLFDTFTNDGNMFYKNFVVRCNTIYDLYVFYFSIIKLIAFNILNNMNEIKSSSLDNLLHQTQQPYIFFIDKIEISNSNIKVVKDDIDGLDNILSTLSKTFGLETLIPSSQYKIWVGRGGMCSFTPFSNLKNMVGVINKINDPCLVSQLCMNYNAYSFINRTDEYNIHMLARGEMVLVNYDIMCAEEDIPNYFENCVNVNDMLNHPEIVSVYRVEKYDLYTVSDYVEAISFAMDIIQTMDTAKKLIGGDEAMSETMLEIRAEVPDIYDRNDIPIKFSYNITKSSLDFGEITNVPQDFLNKLRSFLNANVPF